MEGELSKKVDTKATENTRIGLVKFVTRQREKFICTQHFRQVNKFEVNIIIIIIIIFNKSHAGFKNQIKLN